MHRCFRFFVLAGLVLLFAACSTTEKRLKALESQRENMLVLDLRLTNAEDRLTQVEKDMLAVRTASAHPSGKAAGKTASVPEKTYSLHPAPPEPRPAPVVVASSPSRPVMESRPAPPAPELLPIALADSPPPAEAKRPAQTQVSKAPKNPGGTEKSAYDAALSAYYSGQYTKALDGFGEFLRRSPSSSLAPNAMYWQGECLYSQGKFDTAIMTFKDLAGKYPQHPKAAAALLKAGFAYAQLKDMENARFYWQILLDDFPKSEPAGMARKRMAQG